MLKNVLQKVTATMVLPTVTGSDDHTALSILRYKCMGLTRRIMNSHAKKCSTKSYSYNGSSYCNRE